MRVEEWKFNFTNWQTSTAYPRARTCAVGRKLAVPERRTAPAESGCADRRRHPRYHRVTYCIALHLVIAKVMNATGSSALLFIAAAAAIAAAFAVADDDEAPRQYTHSYL